MYLAFTFSSASSERVKLFGYSGATKLVFCCESSDFCSVNRTRPLLHSNNKSGVMARGAPPTALAPPTNTSPIIIMWCRQPWPHLQTHHPSSSCGANSPGPTYKHITHHHHVVPTALAPPTHTSPIIIMWCHLLPEGRLSWTVTDVIPIRCLSMRLLFFPASFFLLHSLSYLPLYSFLSYGVPPQFFIPARLMTSVFMFSPAYTLYSSSTLHLKCFKSLLTSLGYFPCFGPTYMMH